MKTPNFVHEGRRGFESIVGQFVKNGQELPGPYKSKHRVICIGANRKEDENALKKDLKDSIIKLSFIVNSLESGEK